MFFASTTIKKIKFCIKLVIIPALSIITICQSCSKAESNKISPGQDTSASNTIKVNDVGITIANKVYKLSFSDDFSGDQLDTSKWHYRLGTRLICNQLSQNITQQGGYLKILLKKEPGTYVENVHGLTHTPSNKDYTCGGIISNELFTTGYYESRIKMPQGAGWHTSFWLAFYNSFKDEIDIEENDSRSNSSDGFQNKYHFGIIDWLKKPAESGYDTGAGVFDKFPDGTSFPNLADDFHVYGCEVTNEGISFYLDNKFVKHYNFTKDMHNLQVAPANVLLTSVATGADAKGINTHLKAVDDTKLPLAAEFDWVKIYTSK